MKRTFFALSLVFSAAWAACGLEDSDSIETVSSPLVGDMRYGNCTPDEEEKLQDAVQILVQITGTRFSAGVKYPEYEACLASAFFVENGSWSGAQIAHLLRMNTMTGIWCWDLPSDTIAQAWEKPFNNEEVYFNKTFLASLSPARIAATIGHELMHNRGFWHSVNNAGSVFYPNTVPEQVEACILNGVPNPRWMPPDPGGSCVQNTCDASCTARGHCEGMCRIDSCHCIRHLPGGLCP
jgi:hypothetical protein